MINSMLVYSIVFMFFCQLLSFLFFAKTGCKSTQKSRSREMEVASLNFTFPLPARRCGKLPAPGSNS